MMKKLTLLVCFSSFVFVCFAQTQPSFSMVSNPSTVQADPQNTDIEAIMNITNLENVSKTIRWVRTVSMNGSCMTQVCDLNLCWLPSVANKTFVLGPNQTGEIIVHMINQTGGQCCAVVNLHMSNEANAADSLNAVFVFDCASGTQDLLPVDGVVVFPNPASSEFNLSNADNVSALRIYAADGREVAYMPATPNHHYLLPEQAAGVYYVVLENKDGKKFRAIQLQKE